MQIKPQNNKDEYPVICNGYVIVIGKILFQCIKASVLF